MSAPRWVWANATATLLARIADRSVTRAALAEDYAFAIGFAGDRADWACVNEAILSRWSVSGLNWIKRRAWQIVTAKAEGV